jgi:hypothetical protein
VWSVLAAAALATRVGFAERIPGTQLFFLLAIFGFGLLLQPIATLHVHFAPRGAHAAVMSTLAGTATALLGLVAVLTDDLEPAALFFLGMWWWVVGKFAVQSGSLPSLFGWITAAAGLIAFLAAIGNVFGVGRWTWDGTILALAVWLVALAFNFRREAAGKGS